MLRSRMLLRGCAVVSGLLLYGAMTGVSVADENSTATDRALAPLATIDISAGGVGSRMWLGDLTGDGRYELVMAQPDGGFNDAYYPHSVNALTAYDLEGNQLWQIGTPSETARSGSDIPCQLYDFDNDGQLEVLAVMDEQIKVFNGKTGAFETSIPLPHEHAHDCIMIANLSGDDHRRRNDRERSISPALGLGS